ncbi:MAG: FAD-dependent oxidoreductase [Anaerolineae bacterium]|nr:FAD-dependent oxidoreductase [Anaerolineae bacterium]
MANYVIIGGVAGGATAAARLRRRDEFANIILLERGKYVSFANCGLPYHISGVIAEREALLVSTPEKLHDEFNIDVRTEHEAVRIDREDKGVEVREVRTGRTYRLPYDKLILSPGARPFVPPVPGVDLEGVHTLRTIPDMDAIKEKVDSGQVREAVVVGGGFIGLEMAENLIHRGLRVTLVEMLKQVMSPLDFEMSAILHRHLREKGLRLGLGDALKEIQRAENGRLKVILSSGRSVEADLVVLALGVRPESDLAREAGLDLGPRGHVLVNEFMQTSDPDIYAVGDVIQVIHPVLNIPTAIPLAGPANRQARIAADHITGLENPYRGTWGTSIVKVFDMAAGCTGVNRAMLEREGVEYRSCLIHSQDHVSYYPGAMPLSIKLFYSPEGKIFGAQAVGYKGVERTINTFAAAIMAGMTVFDLEHLELAYAPPFGAAKDPVNLAGYVASNQLRGDTDLIEWSQIAELDPDEWGILDVRSDAEWELGHIPGAIHIPNTELRARLDELSKERKWVLYCAIGRRAYVMERMLKQRGYRAYNLAGGWTTYSVATEPQSNFETWEPLQEQVGAVAALADPSDDPPAVQVDTSVNACGLQCPGPILAVYKKMAELQEGQVLEVLATDPGFRRDVAAWCERTGNQLLSVSQEGETIRALIRKGHLPEQPATPPSANAKTMIVFSDDLDKALAAFVIANGAAAMGQKVTMFFTFWGLNILRRKRAPKVKKSLIERMFGWMLPKGADALKLSKLNMAGLGTEMIKKVMRSKKIDSLPQFLKAAQENGVRLIACQMTMDLMGIKPEELIDGVEIGGVATYLNETDKASATLFIG